jgi:hypothetical protein
MHCDPPCKLLAVNSLRYRAAFKNTYSGGSQLPRVNAILTGSVCGVAFQGVKSSVPLKLPTNAASRSAARSMSSSDIVSTALCM